MTMWIFRLAVLCVCFCRAAMPLGAQDLRILCESGGRSLTLGGVDKDGKVLVLDGDKAVPAPKDAVWRLEGDVRSQREWFAWAPPYELTRYEEQEVVKNPGFLFRANIRFHAVPHKTQPKTSTRMTVRSRWTREGLSSGVLVSCWMSDGQVMAVDVHGATTLEGSVMSGEIPLTAEQAKGQAAVLLWSDGRLEKPEPIFADPIVETAVLAALIDDDTTAIGTLLEKQPQLARQTTHSGKALLSIMAEAGSDQAVKVLIAADIKLRKEWPKARRTPLQDAAAKGRDAVVAELLAAKFEKDEKETDTTALVEAATAGHTETVKVLITAGADANFETSDHRSAFTQAADRGYVDILEMVLPRMSWTYRNTPQDEVVLRTQAHHGHTAMVRWMLGKKVSPNSRQPGFSALGLAALEGHRETIDVLIAGKADVKWRDEKSGLTSLMLAVGKGHLDCVDALIKAGADVKAVSHTKNSVLHIAAQADSGGIIERLLAHGADLGARNLPGFSALEMALIGQNEKAVAALEKAGARLDLKFKHVDLTLEAALTMDRDELIARALADGWPASTRLREEWPALLVAKFLGAKKCAALLAKAGADESFKGPYAIVRPKELDVAPSLSEVVIPTDPRPAGEVFEAQVVMIEAMVAADGRVLFPKIIDTPEKRLGQAVVDVLPAWRLTPLTTKGVPAATKIRLPVEFPASEVRTFNLKDLDELPKAVSQQPPQYPFKNLVKGQEARATIQFTVGADGAVKDARVIEHTGEEFAEAAMKSVRAWKYSPGKMAGKAVAVRMQVPIIFSLDD